MSTWLAGISVLLAFMTVLWLASLALHDVSIVDRFWGLTFALQISSFAYFSGEALDFRQGLVVTLVWLWALRLSLHIHLRNRGHGEDIRYRRMREEHGDKKFRWYSLVSIFLLQGGLSALVGLPLAFVVLRPGANSFTAWDFLALLTWSIGFIFEAGGDWQLARFKNDPANQGKLLTRGLWSLTRHPNYFGDATLWWGFFLFALNSPSGLWSVVGPIAMSLFIYHVSGVKLLEKDLIKKKPEYETYISTTPAFFPDIRKLFN